MAVQGRICADFALSLHNASYTVFWSVYNFRLGKPKSWSLSRRIACNQKNSLHVQAHRVRSFLCLVVAGQVLSKISVASESQLVRIRPTTQRKCLSMRFSRLFKRLSMLFRRFSMLVSLWAICSIRPSSFASRSESDCGLMRFAIFTLLTQWFIFLHLL